MTNLQHQTGSALFFGFLAAIFAAGCIGDADMDEETIAVERTIGAQYIEPEWSAENALEGYDGPLVEERTFHGDFVAEDEEDLEELAGYTRVSDRVTIRGSSLTNIDALENLREVGAIHIVSNPNLTNIDGLQSLTSVLGDVVIHGNPALATLDGLGSLREVHGSLVLGENEVLGDLDGLSSLTRVGWDVSVYNNHEIVSAEGLRSLRSVGWILTFQTNNSLSLLGLHSLSSVGSTVRIIHNRALPTCEADALTVQLRSHDWNGDFYIVGTWDEGVCEDL